MGISVTKQRLSIRLATSAFIIFCTGCASNIGSSVDVPEIPGPEMPQNTRAKLGATVAIAGIKDVRTSVSTDAANSDVRFTEPQGDITVAVEGALQKALREKGILVGGESPVTIWGEVRNWRSKVDTTTVSKIQSEAAIYIEVQSLSGSTLYSGTFRGSRSSQFPVASPSDVKDSLGIAMSEAIAQLLDDEDFLNSLWKN